MSHHSEYPGLDPVLGKIVECKQDEIKRAFKEMLKDTTGATGRFPEGKIAAHDEGEIAFAVGHSNGKVLIEFGKEISSLGMNAKQAVEMAESLLAHARAVSDDVLTIQL